VKPKHLYTDKSKYYRHRTLKVGCGVGNMVYSTESDVYDATGMKTESVQKLSGKNVSQVSTMIAGMIVKADRMIKNELGIPITIRKEYHMFDDELFIELGPQEDRYGFFGAYESQNCVEDVFAIYTRAGRVKLPYPKNCDSLTESIADMQAGSNCTLSAETSIFKCGITSIKAIFSAAGTFYFSKDQNMNKNIEAWNYVGFWFRTSDKTATFTIKIFDVDGNYVSKTFTLSHNNTWEIVKLQLTDFTNWVATEFNEDRLMQYIQIESNKACTIYFDNFNFNDGLFWTYPEGLIVWSEPNSDVGNLQIEVTYAFDPYKISTPEEVTLASSKKAGILLLEFLIGCRQRVTAFIQSSDALDSYPDKETLEFRRAELQRQVEGILAGIGFKTYSGMVGEG
jgi:hypothetical protein